MTKFFVLHPVSSYSCAGNWVNTANIDADVVINSTHIIETWHPDVGRYVDLE